MSINRIAIQTKTTQVGTFTGSAIDVSAVSFQTQEVLVLEILSQVGTSRFVFQDSIDGGTTWLDAWSVSLAGPIVSAAAIRWSLVLPRESDMRIGLASGRVRLVLGDLSGAGQTVTYQSFLEVSQ